MNERDPESILRWTYGNFDRVAIVASFQAESSVIIDMASRLRDNLRVLTLETQTLARACGKSHVHNLEPEDLVALTIEAAAMARVPLAGTDWIPGRSVL